MCGAELDPESLTITWLALVNGLIHNWMLDPGRFNLREEGLRSLTLFLDGLRPTGTPPARRP